MNQLFCVKLETEIDNFRYSLDLPVGAQFSQVREVLANFGLAVDAMEKQAMEQAQASKEASDAIEQVATSEA